MSTNWERDWSVSVTLKHEREQPGGITEDTITIEQGVEADDAEDALSVLLMQAADLYNLNLSKVTVIRIDIMRMDAR